MPKTKTQTNIYIDLDTLKQTENPKYVRLKELANARMDMKLEEKALKERLAVCDAELKAFIETYSADGFVIPDDMIIADRIEGRSAGKWDKAKLVAILTPEQLERVYTGGKTFSYVKVEENVGRCEQALED